MMQCEFWQIPTRLTEKRECMLRANWGGGAAWVVGGGG